MLPAVADRPLVMKRFPNGIAAKPFYQHRAPEVPPGVRSAVVSVVETTAANHRRRPEDAALHDAARRDLAGPVVFARAASRVCRLQRLRPRSVRGRALRHACSTSRAGFVTSSTCWAPSACRRPRAPTACTSTSRCRAGTPYEAGLLFCQIVATVVAQKHPKVATTSAPSRARGKRVYIDCLQNILGKTLATAYSARASEYAGVSTPMTWQEIDDGFDHKAFTIETAPARFEKVGDLWAALRKSKGVDLSASRATRSARARDVRKATSRKQVLQLVLFGRAGDDEHLAIVAE